jgi:hypothetical protein
METEVVIAEESIQIDSSEEEEERLYQSVEEVLH